MCYRYGNLNYCVFIPLHIQYFLQFHDVSDFPFYLYVSANSWKVVHKVEDYWSFLDLQVANVGYSLGIEFVQELLSVRDCTPKSSSNLVVFREKAWDLLY